ncbi:peroxisomal 3,2-trans-enoyl-CoA isomerase [Fistulifera solaris]|uniref:Peroxisomal 3,2-trans-enoyl-CoA isomerase n=1 Tax=Fistulifera solaris TaxID=1519565 RepID=A0A1Z5KFQ2_FISSO|nr:peroxisomal 3,2-trans-enoyl-CoA isomerase [Fistulifera solaris]|eukprot:GAX25036.1 peroxisomal 3,2-trans-enoyl-CoA isomerase [Fistulifera solaris]
MLRVCRRGKERSILMVALHRPRSMNAFNDDMYEDLIDLMNATIDDDSIAAIVLTGTGEYFSSGADLKNGNFHPEAGGRRTLQKPAGRFMMSLIAYPKIIAAAVQGPAVGIAVTLLMHCDLVHASQDASFWAPFTRLALVPELCSSVTFRESMGLSKANELLLLGKKIDAATALDYNIISRVVEPNIPNDKTSFDYTNNVAENLCSELDRSLLSLPLGARTSSYFVHLIRGGCRKEQLQEVCRRELVHLDERFDNGHTLEAAKSLKIGSNGKHRPPNYKARL